MQTKSTIIRNKGRREEKMTLGENYRSIHDTAGPTKSHIPRGSLGHVSRRYISELSTRKVGRGFGNVVQPSGDAETA